MSPFLLLLTGMALVLGGILGLRLHAFLALLLGAFAVSLLTPQEALETYAAGQVEKGKMTEKAAADFAAPGLRAAPARVVGGFGETCGKVGVLIAMAAVIGQCLMASGAARQIVETILKVVGAARAHLAFLGSGFLLAVPVFFDTVFYLLIPIGKAMRRRTGKNYLLYILTIVAGATMAHSLVPPTPGPLFVAGELDVEVGEMMLAGVLVGACAVAAGYAFALWANRRWEVPLRDDETGADGPGGGGAEPAGAEPVEIDLPPVWLAFLPVLLPVVLIAAGTICAPLMKGLAPAEIPAWMTLVALLGDKNVALTVAAATALATLARQRRNEPGEAAAAVQAALGSGAVIILITAAGGAFGGVLRHTGIAGAVRELAGGSGAGLVALPVAFLVTALVRTAQGSATVAMITAAPVAAAFLEQGDLPFHPVYLALAIGCGSKPIPWMNDSGFWVITRMTGMREAETLKFVTTMMTLMGVVGLLVTVVAAAVFPMV